MNDIETERLRLRPLKSEDSQAMYDLLSDPAVSGNIGVFSQPFTNIQAEGWCGLASVFHRESLGYLCGLYEKESPQKMIGYAGIAWTDDHRPRDEWEAGYWLTKKHWHQGIAAEALSGIIKQKAGDLGVRMLFAEAAQSNYGSIRVMEKCGFKKTAAFLKKTPDNPARQSVRYERIL